MFHMRKFSNTRSTPAVSSSGFTNTRDISNHASSTKLTHRRKRPSITKSQVSKPFPILAYDERELFDAMASGNIQARKRRIPKAAEKKVKIVAPEPVKPQHKHKVPADPPSRPWYTPAKAQPPAKGASERSVSNAAPRSIPPKADVGRTEQFKIPAPASLAKSAEDTVRPTARLVSKPLPDLPIDSLSSRWSESTGSVYSDDRPFSVLGLFPDPPIDAPNAASLDDLENYNSLSTPSAFMSFSNTSSSSVATILAPTPPDPPTFRPPMLKAVPKPKVATLVYQYPRASHSFSRVQDSIAVQRGRAHPKTSKEGNIHTSSIRTAGSASRGRTSSPGSSSRAELAPAMNIEALVFPRLRGDPEQLERFDRARLERARVYELEQEEELRLKLSDIEMGYNPFYKGRKQHEREVAHGFELIKPDKKPWKWF